MPETSPPTTATPAQFLPKIFTVLREGYGVGDLRADVLAGLTVAIVALPLSMAIAIASGVGPERGLFTAIIGGFLVSLLGGSRFQIGGPAGAFIVLISACVTATGIDGLILATLLSGVFMIAMGVLRLGTYIKYIPYPVTVGFTAGIGVIIFTSQIKDLMGLSLTGEPAAIIPKLEALWAAKNSFTPAAFGVAIAVIAMIVSLKRLRPHWPGMLIAIAVAATLSAVLHLPIETIASRFGELPRVLPAPALPQINAATLQAALPWAASFALLGSIESLLSAVVADGMSGRRHRSNAELVAQGVANMGAALFGGFCVTGTIARTATNVRAGSRGPISGMLHAVFVLLFMLIAAPLAGYIPLAALAGVLALVAWNMAEKAELWALIRSTRGDAMVVIVTFLLVVFRDLTEGIVVGFALGGLVFIRAMSDAAGLDMPEPAGKYDPTQVQDSRLVVYHLRGPFFFGAAAQLGTVLDQIADHPRALVLDFTLVPFIDSSGARSFELLAHKCLRKGGQLFLTGTTAAQRSVLHKLGVHAPLVHFLPDVAAVEALLSPELQGESRLD